MRALIFGANGQLGWELLRRVPDSWEARGLSRAECDIGDRAAVMAQAAAFAPHLVVNAAAHTAVDRAESEAEAAFRVNGAGAGHIAEAASRTGARLIHVSTDFVFDGTRSRPYAPDDPVNPLGVYGASKAAGEAAVREIGGDRALILRTAWVYGAHGQNFVKTMLRLMAERDQVRVVADQVGTPTWAGGMAEAIWRLAALPEVQGTLHWTDAGVASWYDFAVAIQEEALALGLLTRAVPVVPIRTKDYPTPARRPPYSVLDKTGTWALLGPAPHWRVALRAMLGELRIRHQPDGCLP